MHKKPLILLVFLASLFLAGCSTGTDDNLPPTDAPSPTPAVNLEEYLSNGSALVDQSKFTEAETVFQEAIDLYPDSALA